MKYKPRNSNFVDMQDEFADELASACRTYRDGLEEFKDVVAKYIDGYLDAIIKEHLEERQFMACCGKEPSIMFCLGENQLSDGTTDLFYTDRPLREVLDGLDPKELDEADHAAATAVMFEELAARFRVREQEIIREDEEFAARYANESEPRNE